jgi:hypothetical protein
MTIQDAMAEAILQEVLANPDRFPDNLRAAAREHWGIWRDLDWPIVRERHGTASFLHFKEELGRCPDLDRSQYGLTNKR